LVIRTVVSIQEGKTLTISPHNSMLHLRVGSPVACDAAPHQV
jgi:hypothetical protein